MLTPIELETRIKNVREQLRSAARLAQRDPENIQLLAVSKTHPKELIQWAYDHGQIDFGENYVQEALLKQTHFQGTPLRWHFIGKLQKNKVKNVVGAFHLIHSVDSIELAHKISTKASELNLDQGILLEVNLAQEDSKGGFSPALVEEQFHEIMSLPHLRLEGLMALPPMNEDPELNRPYFRQLHQIFEKLARRIPPQRSLYWKWLSMGTSQDYAVAIQEGANIVRVGTAIFGARIKEPSSL